MRTKTYVFEDIKKGMELIKEKYGPDALIVDIRSLGNNGNKRCEISVLVQDDMLEVASSGETYRRQIEEVWESVQSAISERIFEVEKYLYIKRVESYPLSLRTLFDKMRKNGVDLKLSFDLVSQAFVEAGDLIDSMTKAYYFLKNVIKKRMKFYEIKKDTSPIILFGPEDTGKSLTSRKIVHLLRNSGISSWVIHFSQTPKTTSIDFSRSVIGETYGIFITQCEEDLRKKMSLAGDRKVIIDVSFPEHDQIENLVSKLFSNSERILILSAGMRDEKIVSYCDRYRNLISGVAFTKVDEEIFCGHLLTHLIKLQVPISFLGIGKEIEDILTPEEERFFKTLIEGNTWMGRERRLSL